MIPWRGATVHSNRQDNPDSDAHKSENNVSNIERNNPARRTNVYPARAPTTLGWSEEDSNNNGGKRRLMTNLRFSFLNRSFSRFLIILSILRGGIHCFVDGDDKDRVLTDNHKNVPLRCESKRFIEMKFLCRFLSPFLVLFCIDWF